MDASTSRTTPAAQSPTKAIVFCLWAALVIVFCFKILRDLVTQTNFFDGLIYASLARNMAAGIGTAYRPHFSASLFPLFSEHPPMMFWLQALAYRVFGDGIWIEKTYSFLAALLGGLLMLLIWRRLTRDDAELRDAGAVALILALVSGRLGWAYANNMLENTLIVFTTAAIYLIVRLYGTPVTRPYPARLPFLVGTGLTVWFAVLTKGPVGLFPLAAIALHWIAFRRPSFRTAIIDSLTVLAVLLIVFALLCQFPEPRAYVDRYLHMQLLASLTGTRGSTGSRWHTLWSLARVNVPAITITMAIVAGGRVAARRITVGATVAAASRGRNAAFLFLVGLSASAPLVASPRIHNFYFNTSIPYFAAALATLSAPSLLNLLRALDERHLRRLQWLLGAALAASIAVVALAVGKPGRDKAVIGDVARIGAYVCADERDCERALAVCGRLWEDWQLHAYFQRDFGISLFDERGTNLPQGVRFKIAGSACPQTAPGEVEIDLGLSHYRLLER